MDKGLPYEAIPELEESEFNDWLAASQALDIDRKLIMINAATSPHWKQSDRSAEFNRLKIDQAMLLGDNPYAVSEEGVKKTHEKLKSMGRVKRVKKDGNNDKGNTRKTKT
jgi:hypothetical protein